MMCMLVFGQSSHVAQDRFSHLGNLFQFCSCDHVSLLCQLKQLKVVDVHRFLLRGIIRSEKKCLDYIVPQSLRVRF